MRSRAARTAAACLALAGCVRTYEMGATEVLAVDAREQPLKTAINLPGEFVALVPPSLPGGCPPRLRDDGMDATLSLVHAVSLPQRDSLGTTYRWLGDYAIRPTGVYGESEGEGLRVDCSRLRALGVVAIGRSG